MGLGLVLTYAAYKDVPVFGTNGLVGGALFTGKLQKADKLKPKVTPNSTVPPSNNPANPVRPA